MNCNRCGCEMEDTGSNGYGLEIFECPNCNHEILLTMAEVEDLEGRE